MIISDVSAPVNRFQDDSRDGRLPKESGAIAPLIEQLIHRPKRFTRSDTGGRKEAITWKAVPQAECDKLRPIDRINMREPASSEGHDLVVDKSTKILRPGRTERPPQAEGLPH